MIFVKMRNGMLLNAAEIVDVTPYEGADPDSPPGCTVSVRDGGQFDADESVYYQLAAGGETLPARAGDTAVICRCQWVGTGADAFIESSLRHALIIAWLVHNYGPDESYASPVLLDPLERDETLGVMLPGDHVQVYRARYTDALQFEQAMCEEFRKRDPAPVAPGGDA